MLCTSIAVRHVLVRHEAAAAFAAGGYARTSGRVGVCCATSGPGATNLVTGLLDAMMDSVPLVAITGQVRTELMGTDGFQEADVCAITQPVTKRNMLVSDVHRIGETIAEAFALARHGRPGPVLVDIPNDVLKARIDATAGPEPPAYGGGDGPRVSDAAVRDAVARIRAARRPVAIIGGGVRAGAVDLYRLFVAMLGLPHAATINALGAAAPGDPNYLGMLGMHGLKAANKAVQRADLLVALGMRFDDRVTGKPDRFAREAAVIHADIDATEFGKIVPADVTLHGDLRETLRALVDELARGHVPRFDDWAAEARLLGGPLPSDRVQNDELSATGVLDRLFAAIPPDAIVTTDVGQHQMWAAQRAQPAHPRKYATSAGLGAMGFGFPGRDRGRVRESRNAGLRDRRRRRLPDVPAGACDAAALRRPRQDRVDRQPEPRHGAPVAGALLLPALLGDEPGRQPRLRRDRPRLRDRRVRRHRAGARRRRDRTVHRLARAGTAALRVPPDRERVADDPGRHDGRRSDGSAGMTCDLTLRDVRSVARIVNLAHRFNCRTTRIAVQAEATVSARFSFDGPDIALSRLRAQIDRIMSYEEHLT